MVLWSSDLKPLFECSKDIRLLNGPKWNLILSKRIQKLTLFSLKKLCMMIQKHSTVKIILQITLLSKTIMSRLVSNFFHKNLKWIFWSKTLKPTKAHCDSGGQMSSSRKCRIFDAQCQNTDSCWIHGNSQNDFWLAQVLSLALKIRKLLKNSEFLTKFLVLMTKRPKTITFRSFQHQYQTALKIIAKKNSNLSNQKSEKVQERLHNTQNNLSLSLTKAGFQFHQ